MIKKIFNYGQNCNNIFKLLGNVNLDLVTLWEDKTIINYSKDDNINFKEENKNQIIDINNSKYIKALITEYSDLELIGNTKKLNINQLDTETIWSQIKGNILINIQNEIKNEGIINFKKLKGENFSLDLNKVNFNVKKSLISLILNFNINESDLSINKLGITKLGDFNLNKSYLNINNIYGFENSLFNLNINYSKLIIKNLSIITNSFINDCEIDLNINNLIKPSMFNINNSKGIIKIYNKVNNNLNLNMDNYSKNNVKISYYDNYFDYLKL